jgi:aldehyde dehydrogenase (NAD+)
MEDLTSLFQALGLSQSQLATGDIVSRSPIDGRVLGAVPADSPPAIAAKIARATEAYRAWRLVPAPRRGELVRLFGEELRACKGALGRLVTLETGKILEEGRGEVQEMIDVCDFAVGLSRQLYGLTIATERPGHRMMETWHPLSPIGVITAFNFPVAVLAWNAMVALVCGDPVVWKASELTPLTALACQALFERAIGRFGACPGGLLEVVQGGAEAGMQIAADPRLGLVSATGSCRMGKGVAPVVAGRMARCLLELGGNNAAVVTPSADLDLAVRAITFAWVGTAGQRCTSLRRLVVHEDIKDVLLERLKRAASSVRIGNPLEATTLMGPLINRRAWEAMQSALTAAKEQGGTVFGGGRVDVAPDAYYVAPALVDMPGQTAIVRRVHAQPGGSRDFHRRGRQRLRHRQRQYRSQRCRNRGRVRRRERDRRRPRVGVGRVEGLHAPGDQHDQLFGRPAFGSGHPLRRRLGFAKDAGKMPALQSTTSWERGRHARIWSNDQAIAAASSRLHSQAAPRTPLASPCRGGTRRVTTVSENTQGPHRSGTFW